jgi:hypothetical protein
MLLACLNKSTENVDWRQSFRLVNVTCSSSLTKSLLHSFDLNLVWFKGVSRRFGKCTCPSLETASTFWARVTSSWDLAFVIKEPANRYWRDPKDHKVGYVLVIGLHQSHWLIHYGHCSAHHSHWGCTFKLLGGTP